MKCSRELKNYISRFRKQLKAICFDDLMIFKIETCKKNKKKVKEQNKKELREELKNYDGE